MAPPSDAEEHDGDSSRPAHEDIEDDVAEQGGSVTGQEASEGAPRYSIPHRVLGAVEIPAVVENVDRAVKAFGRTPSFQQVSRL